MPTGEAKIISKDDILDHIQFQQPSQHPHTPRNALPSIITDCLSLIA
jgi:hypothetical protein